MAGYESSSYCKFSICLFFVNIEDSCSWENGTWSYRANLSKPTVRTNSLIITAHARCYHQVQHMHVRLCSILELMSFPGIRIRSPYVVWRPINYVGLQVLDSLMILFFISTWFNHIHTKSSTLYTQANKFACDTHEDIPTNKNLQNCSIRSQTAR